MPVEFESLLIGEEYGRPELAKLWGYRDWHAIGRGIFTPSKEKKLVLFVTEEKQEALTQYRDHFDGDQLFMQGEKSHSSDHRLALSTNSGDEIHLFHRRIHHIDFTYLGLVQLVGHRIREDVPSEFVFRTSRSEAIASSALKSLGSLAQPWGVRCASFEASGPD